MLSLGLGVGVGVGVGVGCGGSGGGNSVVDGGGDANLERLDALPAGCGDGVRIDPEVCDDGNSTDGDGCATGCDAVEPFFRCPTEGGPCLRVATCGNAIVEPDEGCDDRNTTPGDGCSATCQTEAGWACAVPGIRCTAAACGDGVVAGFEACDDGGAATPGCSASCQLEPGFVCATPGAGCSTTTCGDAQAQGTEACDDGNNDLGDGCDPLCRREPVCADGVCTAVCGDGVLQGAEPCDDGNPFDGDGCSATCVEETGFACVATTSDEPATFPVTVVYRDFRGFDLTGGHVDFQNKSGAEPGIVEAQLGADGKPVYNGNPITGTNTTAGKVPFDQWYRDTAGVNVSVVEPLILGRTGPGTYVFDDATFFPLDTRGWVGLGMEGLRLASDGQDHNFHFTSELRYWFTYQGGENLEFRGDDDVWVFVNGRLAIDLGGVHGATTGAITLDAGNQATVGLTAGGTYEVVVFQAERRTIASSYKLTLRGFNAARSVCDDTCGDGVTSSYEVCDDGVNAGGYGSCLPGCLGFGPRCGDGVVQMPEESCDDGNTVNGDQCPANCNGIIL